jgi:hypothetical protein
MTTKPLNAMAKAAIMAYVEHWMGREGHYTHIAVERAVKAERMPRSSLYAFLHGKGYKYNRASERWMIR